MEKKVFDYRGRILKNRIVIVVFIALAAVILLSVIFSSLQTIIAGSYQAGESFSKSLLTILLCLGALLFFVGIVFLDLVLYPRIEVVDNQFRISRLLYKSRWLRWTDIDNIRQHILSNKHRRLLVFFVDDVGPLYSFLGLVHLSRTPAFYVNDRINNFAKLIDLVRKHRPDLV
jgi:hypothetical protein